MRLSLCTGSSPVPNSVRRRKPLIGADAAEQIGTLGVTAAIAAPIGLVSYMLIENVGAAIVCGFLALSTLLGILSEPSGQRH